MLESMLLGVLLLAIVWQAWRKKIGLFAPAMGGFRSGLGMCRRVLPMVAGYVLAFACFRAVGGFDWLLQGLHPVLQHVGVPDGMLPILLARPFSGSLASGLFAEMAQAHLSPLLLLQSAVMLGSTETTLYVITVYFAYVGVKKSRYAIPLGLMLDLLGCVLAVWGCRLLFT